MLDTSILRKLTIAALFLPLPASALPSHPIDLTHAFASCAGRMEALARHASMTTDVDQTPQSTDARARAEHFSMMLEAVEPHARDLGLREGEARRWTTSARAAHGVLLVMAENGNRSSSVRAAHAAQLHMTTCAQLILGG